MGEAGIDGISTPQLNVVKIPTVAVGLPPQPTLETTQITAENNPIQNDIAHIKTRLAEELSQKGVPLPPREFEPPNKRRPPGILDNILEAYKSSVLEASTTKTEQEITNLRQSLTDIAVNGTVDKIAILDYTELPGGYGDRMSFLKYREMLLKLYSRDPELARGIVANRITGGHGSTSASLIGALETGLRPHEEVFAAGGIVNSGEGMAQAIPMSGLNDEICFAQYWDTGLLLRYSTYHVGVSAEEIQTAIVDTQQEIEWCDRKDAFDPKLEQAVKKRLQTKINYLQRTKDFLAKPDKTSEEQLQATLLQENFPIIYLAQAPSDNQHVYKPSSGMRSEYWVVGGQKPEDIKYVLVPEDKITTTQDLVAKKGRTWIVKPLDSLRIQATR